MQLEAALFEIEDGGIRLVGRTTDPAAVTAAKDAIARGHAARAEKIRSLQASGSLHLVRDAAPEPESA